MIEETAYCLIVGMALAFCLFWEGVGLLALRIGKRRRTESHEEETAANLPWWLPVSFLEFRMPLFLCLLTSSLFLYGMFAVQTIFMEKYGFALRPRCILLPFLDLLWKDSDCLLLYVVLVPFWAFVFTLIPDLFHELGRLFARKRILLARTGQPSRLAVRLLVGGFLLAVLLFGIMEERLWSADMDQTRRTVLTVFYLRKAHGVLFVLSTACGILVWAVSATLFRFRISEENCADGTSREVSPHLGVSVLRSFAIPLSLAYAVLFVSVTIFKVDSRSAAFCSLFGWMFGLHLWAATVPLMLLARKAVPLWIGLLLLGTLAVFPAFVLLQ